jgi:hypothetical protein
MEKELDEEIDLLDLAVKAIRFIRNHFLFILIWAVIGLSVSLLYRFLSPPVYESRMILSSNVLTDSYSKVITKSLKNLLYEKNYSSLGTLLSITEEEAKDLKAFDIDAEKIEKDKEKEIESGKDETIFIVTIITKRSETLPTLQAGIIRLLQNNEFSTIRVRQRKEFYKSVVDKIGTEINSLDSVKRSLFFGSSHPKGSETLFVDASNIYTQLINLYKERLYYKNALEVSDSIQLVEGFIVSKRPPQTRLLMLLIYGLLGGMSIAFGFLILSPLYKLANKTPN